jgi:hypothetical protein
MRETGLLNGQGVVNKFPPTVNSRPSVQTVEYAPDGKCLLSVQDGEFANQVQFWDLRGGSPTKPRLHSSDTDWRSMVLAAKGDMLVTFGIEEDKDTGLWRIVTAIGGV